MELIRDSRSAPVSRLEIVDRGRRRRFADEAKLAIVAESYCGSKQVTATACRHGITRWQLHDWRRAAREGKLGGGMAAGFVPALVVREAPAPVEHPRLNGRRVIVDALLGIMRGLETLR